MWVYLIGVLFDAEDLALKRRFGRHFSLMI
jgi:hypothetical protein